MNVRMLMIAALLLLCVALHAQVDHTPKISASNVFVQPIMNNNDPVYRVGTFAVQIPGLQWADSAKTCTVTATVPSSSVRDIKTDETYAVIIVSTSKPVQASQQWRREDHDSGLDHEGYIATFDVLLSLANGPIPLRKGMVKGNVTVAVDVQYTDEDGNTYHKRKMIPTTISN